MTDNDVRRIEDKVDGLALVLARLEGSLNPTLEKLTADQQDADKRAEDHERRIRGLERFRYSVPSMALLSLLVAVATLVYYLTVAPHP